MTIRDLEYLVAYSLGMGVWGVIVTWHVSSKVKALKKEVQALLAQAGVRG